MLSNFTKPIHILIFLSLSHFLVDFMIGIWPIYKTMAHLDLAVAGLIYAVSSMMGEGLQIVFGRASDKGYRKTIILFGLVLASSSAFLAYATNYFALFILFAMTCLGSGAFHPSAVGFISKLTKTKKSLYITCFSCFGSIGFASSQIIFSNTYNFFSGQTWMLIIPYILLTILLSQKSLLTLNEPKTEEEPPKFSLFFKFFKIHSMKMLYISQIANQMTAWGFIFLLPDILKSRGYGEWIVFGGGHLCYILGAVLLLIPSGYIADRTSSRTVVLSASIAAFFFLYAFLLTPALPPLLVLPLLFCLGASIGVVNPVSLAFGHKLHPTHPGMVSAFLMGCVWCISEVLGPGGGGLLTKLFTEDAPARALMIVGLSLPVGIWAAHRLPREIAEEAAPI